jgi:hypothetical protein
VVQERTNTNLYIAMEPLLGAVVVFADSEEMAKQAAQRWFQSQTGIRAEWLSQVAVVRPPVIQARRMFPGLPRIDGQAQKEGA